MEKVSLEIIKLAQQGDEQAYKQIYELNYSHVFYYALKLSGNEADAKDIAQETFLQVYRSISDLRNPQYFPLWLNRIIMSKYMRLLNKRKDTPLEQDTLNYLIDKDYENETMLGDEDILRELIFSLTPKQSEILDMMYYKQLTMKEIARMLKLPEGTVKSRIYQAKSALKPKIEQFEAMEGRRLTFKLDLLVPFSIFALFPKLKDAVQNTGVLQGFGVASLASLVVLSTVAVNQSANMMDKYNMPVVTQVAPLPVLKQFQPVNYESSTILDARTAYYVLMAWAADAPHVQAKTKVEKEQIYPILLNLKESDNEYIKLLEASGWLEAYAF